MATGDLLLKLFDGHALGLRNLLDQPRDAVGVPRAAEDHVDCHRAALRALRQAVAEGVHAGLRDAVVEHVLGTLTPDSLLTRKIRPQRRSSIGRRRARHGKPLITLTSKKRARRPHPYEGATQHAYLL